MSVLKTPLPAIESLIYLCIWLAHSVAAVLRVWFISDQRRNDIYSGLFEPGWSVLGSPRKDTTDFEWETFLQLMYKSLVTFGVHSVMFALTDPGRFRRVHTVVWVVMALWLYHPIAPLTALLFAAAMLSIPDRWSTGPVIWSCALCLLFLLGTSTSYAREYDLIDGEQIYPIEVFLAYKLIQLISFCISCDRTQTLPERFESALHYMFYPPYSVSLIVQYDEFHRQLNSRPQTRLNLPRTLFFASRILFWTLLADFSLHYIYSNALLTDYRVLASLDYPTVAAVAYIAGQFFHLKYVSIFGVPSVFATLDRMTPAPPPVCISRISLYSRMWRHFDCGLYAFMRDTIYRPIAEPTYGVVWKSTATFACFLFVWLWHTPTQQYLVWVCLNFVEIHLEQLISALLRPLVGRVPATALRRVAAVLHIPCVALGIFSIFFFLGGMTSGMVIVRRILIEGSLQFPPRILWILALGYAYCQTCMDLEMKMPPPRVKLE